MDTLCKFLKELFHKSSQSGRKGHKGASLNLL